MYVSSYIESKLYFSVSYRTVNSYFRLDLDLVFGTNILGLSKADRLIYGESLMTHAMTITAAQTVEYFILI